MSIGDETSQEVDGEVGRAAVAGVLYLRNVFELVHDRLDDEAFAQHEPVGQQHQLVFHVFTQ